MLFAEATQDIRNGHVAGPRRTCDRETIRLASDRPADCEHRAVHLHEQVARMLEKEPPGARQPHPPFAAIEQPDLNLFLQLLDLLTERRLGDVEALGGATEMQLFSDGNEVSQMTQLHAVPPSGRAIAEPDRQWDSRVANPRSPLPHRLPQQADELLLIYRFAEDGKRPAA